MSKQPFLKRVVQRLSKQQNHSARPQLDRIEVEVEVSVKVANDKESNKK